ncbi:NADP-dependent oxidoreductase [Rhodococcus coprophilus]|uniref:Zn-containing alcohol dehydrogenase n=1 Tax=Rhodococcus coprophilus TaxID=38310 RepID=A0A2X4UH91_9NOCA|nr:NADP-dependent oxidoreductase [Rhodococcus coprophilus]MBM7458350.1 NADPH:quinone reductase-like Zn-dependent oxidoreductase [Rhodococcus coprophilus]SQI32270.1 Zn-containing alcohol dehydrogenase [Rhodococcus coprophilus]
MNSTTFRTAVVRVPSGPDSIEIIDVPVVSPGPGQVRVAIAGAPVNPVDLGVAGGFFHSIGMIDQPGHTGLGWDFAGTVLERGEGVDLAAGTRVAGMVGGFDRDYGTYAEQLVVPVTALAVVPDDLDLLEAATVPVNGLAAAQMLDLLDDAPADGNRLLVTGAGGLVGGYLVALAAERGWDATGLGRPDDEKFVRGLGAGFVSHAEPGWDAVADAASMQEEALALVRGGGKFVGVKPNAVPAAERGISASAVETYPDAARLSDLLARAASGVLPARVHAAVPLDNAAEAHRAVAAGGVRGRYVLVP